MEIQIGSHTIGQNHPTYFIADISANHDGDLERAKMLIHLAKEAGADAAKFQNFRAPKIVSDYGFKNPGRTSLPPIDLEKIGLRGLPGRILALQVDALPARGVRENRHRLLLLPYDFEAMDMLDPYVPAHKIGSGISPGLRCWNISPARASR